MSGRREMLVKSIAIRIHVEHAFKCLLITVGVHGNSNSKNGPATAAMGSWTVAAVVTITNETTASSAREPIGMERKRAKASAIHTSCVCALYVYA